MGTKVTSNSKDINSVADNNSKKQNDIASKNNTAHSTFIKKFSFLNEWAGLLFWLLVFAVFIFFVTFF